MDAEGELSIMMLRAHQNHRQPEARCEQISSRGWRKATSNYACSNITSSFGYDSTNSAEESAAAMMFPIHELRRCRRWSQITAHFQTLTTWMARGRAFCKHKQVNMSDSLGPTQRMCLQLFAGWLVSMTLRICSFGVFAETMQQQNCKSSLGTGGRGVEQSWIVSTSALVLTRIDTDWAGSGATHDWPSMLAYGNTCVTLTTIIRNSLVWFLRYWN